MESMTTEGYPDVVALYDDTQMVLLAATRPWPPYAEMMAMAEDEQRALSRTMDAELEYQDETLMIWISGKLGVAEKRINRMDPEACWVPVFVADLLRLPPEGQRVTAEDLEVELYLPGAWEAHLRLLGTRARTALLGRLR